MKGIVALLIIGALIGAASWYYSRSVPIEVRLHEVDRGAVRASVSNTRVGTIKACERAQMSASAPGQVASINVAGACGMASLIGILAGLTPALKAAKMNPVDALRAN